MVLSETMIRNIICTGYDPDDCHGLTLDKRYKIISKVIGEGIKIIDDYGNQVTKDCSSFMYEEHLMYVGPDVSGKLTHGKKYMASPTSMPHQVCILRDDGTMVDYKIHLFKTEAQIREDKLKEIVK